MTYTIAMSNEKGGVAKTTSTLSLGAALAESLLQAREPAGGGCGGITVFAETKHEWTGLT